MQETLKQWALDNGLQSLNEPIQQGDLYIAGRNSTPQLFECKEVGQGFIIPVEKFAYCFDFADCLKVKA